jgi:hypothetical protein
LKEFEGLKSELKWFEHVKSKISLVLTADDDCNIAQKKTSSNGDKDDPLVIRKRKLVRETDDDKENFITRKKIVKRKKTVPTKPPCNERKTSNTNVSKLTNSAKKGAKDKNYEDVDGISNGTTKQVKKAPENERKKTSLFYRELIQSNDWYDSFQMKNKSNNLRYSLVLKDLDKNELNYFQEYVNTYFNINRESKERE